MTKGKPLPTENAGETWRDADYDQLLEAYLAGYGFQRISDAMGRSIDSIETMRWKIAVGYETQGEYIPIARMDRSNLRWNDRDWKLFLRWHNTHIKRRGPFVHICNVLGRRPEVVKSDLREYGILKKRRRGWRQ